MHSHKTSDIDRIIHRHVDQATMFLIDIGNQVIKRVKTTYYNTKDGRIYGGTCHEVSSACMHYLSQYRFPDQDIFLKSCRVYDVTAMGMEKYPFHSFCILSPVSGKQLPKANAIVVDPWPTYAQALRFEDYYCHEIDQENFEVGYEIRLEAISSLDPVQRSTSPAPDDEFEDIAFQTEPTLAKGASIYKYKIATAKYGLGRLPLDEEVEGTSSSSTRSLPTPIPRSTVFTEVKKKDSQSY